MDDDLLRQRRNLLSISFVLLLFILGNGDVDSLFGVKLKNGYVAEIFAWIGLLYFWWRFWVFGGDQVKEKYFEDCLVIARKNKVLYERIIEASKGKNLVEYFDDVDHQTNRIDDLTMSLDKENDKQWFLNYRVVFRTNGQVNAYKKLVLDASLVEIIMRISFRYVVLQGTAISDYLLPHILAGLVLIIGVCNILVCMLG